MIEIKEGQEKGRGEEIHTHTYLQRAEGEAREVPVAPIKPAHRHHTAKRKILVSSFSFQNWP
jgi:hypothetical protein